MSNKYPKFVPLPGIGEHTDTLDFDGLALPSGFEADQLLINLRAIDRIVGVAGLGNISVLSVDGEKSQDVFIPTSIGQDGSATTGLSIGRNQRPLANGTVTFPRPDTTIVGRPDAKIHVNKNEISERIRANSGIAGEFDPSMQAKFLDQAISSGLVQSAIDANFDREKLTLSLASYGPISIFGLLSDSEPGLVAGYTLLTPALIMNFGIIGSYFLNSGLFQSRDLDLVDVLKSYRQSIFQGVAPDRIAATKLLSVASRFVKAA